jgi:Tol biopolymer transport system component
MDFDDDGYQDLLLVTEDGTAIWTVLLGSSSQRPVFSDWSPDGQWLLYTNQSGIFTQLYQIKRDGSDNTYISRQGYSNNSNGDYSPDSSTIAFERSGTIYTVLTDGSASAVSIGLTGKWPRWSPDGSALVYYKTDNNLYSAIGGSETQVTNDGDLQIHPSYIAANQIVYSQSSGGQYDVYSADLANIGAAANLTNTGESDTYPSLAPGNRIIYLIDNQTIAIMNTDGSGQTTIYSGPRTITNPRWAP